MKLSLTILRKKISTLLMRFRKKLEDDSPQALLIYDSKAFFQACQKGEYPDIKESLRKVCRVIVLR